MKDIGPLYAVNWSRCSRSNHGMMGEGKSAQPISVRVFLISPLCDWWDGLAARLATGQWVLGRNSNC